MAPPARVTLVYEASCPHVEEARAALREVVSDWTEQRSDVDDAPGWARAHGSPTVLVDGRDVSESPSAGGCCRVYRDADGRRRGAPSVATIRAALDRSRRA